MQTVPGILSPILPPRTVGGVGTESGPEGAFLALFQPAVGEETTDDGSVEAVGPWLPAGDLPVQGPAIAMVISGIEAGDPDATDPVAAKGAMPDAPDDAGEVRGMSGLPRVKIAEDVAVDGAALPSLVALAPAAPVLTGDAPRQETVEGVAAAAILGRDRPDPVPAVGAASRSEGTVADTGGRLARPVADMSEGLPLQSRQSNTADAAGVRADAGTDTGGPSAGPVADMSEGLPLQSGQSNPADAAGIRADAGRALVAATAAVPGLTSTTAGRPAPVTRPLAGLAPDVIEKSVVKVQVASSDPGWKALGAVANRPDTAGAPPVIDVPDVAGPDGAISGTAVAKPEAVQCGVGLLERYFADFVDPGTGIEARDMRPADDLPSMPFSVGNGTPAGAAMSVPAAAAGGLAAVAVPQLTGVAPVASPLPGRERADAAVAARLETAGPAPPARTGTPAAAGPALPVPSPGGADASIAADPGRTDAALPVTPGPTGLAAPGPATASGAASALAPPLPMAPVAAQIAGALVNSSAKVAEIALSPDELGRVRLRLEPDPQTPDRMLVLISVERPETLDLFRRHAGELADALRAAGYSGADIGFGLQSGDGDARDRQPDGRHSEPFAEAEALAPPPLPHNAAGASLDLRL